MTGKLLVSDHRWWSLPGAAIVGMALGGCFGSPTPAPTNAPSSSETAATDAAKSDDGMPESASAAGRDASAAPKKRFQPITLGSGTGQGAASPANGQPESILSALQPLQVLLGKWNGTSRKAQIDQPEWVWDFRTDRQRPSLVMTSEKGTYLRGARLTYLPESQQYQLIITTPENTQRTLVGTFTEPVQDVAGDDKKLQRTFRLTLTEPEASSGEQWQFAFEQLENNRYIVDIDRKRGSSAFQRVDTIHTQREGTSFAVSDTDYGERTCIISQGLGTMTVAHKGQTYYVCCTGCKAAFEEDPERWIAKWEDRKKSMKKS